MLFQSLAPILIAQQLATSTSLTTLKNILATKLILQPLVR